MGLVFCNKIKLILIFLCIKILKEEAAWGSLLFGYKKKNNNNVLKPNNR